MQKEKIYTLINYLITIITYKYVLNISFTKAIISCGIMILSILVLEFIFMCILLPFFTASQARNSEIVNLIINIIFSVLLLVTYSNKKIKEKASFLINKLEKRTGTRIILFVILAIIVTSVILFIESSKFNIKTFFNTNLLVTIIVFLLVIIFVNEQNSYEKLSDEYDNLFNYVKIFEDWIEDEQLTRHEYKNQLAVIRCLTKEKKVKDKIDEIISDTINIDKHMISQLKNLPNGGIKGLLYYKIAIANNQKVNLEVDVSPESGKNLKNLSDDELKVLSKLIGIYCDNAIEAAKETKKKIILIEIYDINDITNIVISNTYNKNKLSANRYEKGSTTKGENRGYGLYFAKKMLSKTSWIEEKQEVIDGYYIETLKISNKKKKSK